MFCSLTGLHLISDCRFAAVMFNNLMTYVNSLNQALMHCPWQVNDSTCVYDSVRWPTQDKRNTLRKKENSGASQIRYPSIQMTQSPLPSECKVSDWTHWSLGHWDLITEQNCTVVNRERQQLFGSYLNFVMNHTYDVCQFKKIIFQVSKISVWWLK